MHHDPGKNMDHWFTINPQSTKSIPTLWVLHVFSGIHCGVHRVPKTHVQSAFVASASKCTQSKVSTSSEYLDVMCCLLPELPSFAFRQVQRGVYLSRPGEENVSHIHRDDPMLQMVRRADDIGPEEIIPDLPPVFAPPRRGQEARRMRMGIGSSRPPSIHVDAFQKRDGPHAEQGGGELPTGDVQDVGSTKQEMVGISCMNCYLDAILCQTMYDTIYHACNNLWQLHPGNFITQHCLPHPYFRKLIMSCRALAV